MDEPKTSRSRSGPEEPADDSGETGAERGDPHDCGEHPADRSVLLGNHQPGQDSGRRGDHTQRQRVRRPEQRERHEQPGDLGGSATEQGQDDRPAGEDRLRDHLTPGGPGEEGEPRLVGPTGLVHAQHRRPREPDDTSDGECEAVVPGLGDVTRHQDGCDDAAHGVLGDDDHPDCGQPVPDRQHPPDDAEERRTERHRDHEQREAPPVPVEEGVPGQPGDGTGQQGDRQGQRRDRRHCLPDWAFPTRGYDRSYGPVLERERQRCRGEAPVGPQHRDRGCRLGSESAGDQGEEDVGEQSADDGAQGQRRGTSGTTHTRNLLR